MADALRLCSRCGCRRPAEHYAGILRTCDPCRVARKRPPNVKPPTADVRCSDCYTMREPADYHNPRSFLKPFKTCFKCRRGPAGSSDARRWERTRTPGQVVDLVRGMRITTLPHCCKNVLGGHLLSFQGSVSDIIADIQTKLESGMLWENYISPDEISHLYNGDYCGTLDELPSPVNRRLSAATGPSTTRPGTGPAPTKAIRKMPRIIGI